MAETDEMNGFMPEDNLLVIACPKCKAHNWKYKTHCAKCGESLE